MRWCSLLLFAVLGCAHAEPVETRSLARAGLFDDEGNPKRCAEVAQSLKRLMNGRLGDRLRGPPADFLNVAYGSSERETVDVFAPKLRHEVPVIVMVHGGGWCVGDKAMAGVTKAKVEHWVVEQGAVFVSVNYPMIPDGFDALAQASFVARAVAYVQRHAAEWGGDGSKVVLMGHSAGAHLVSLVGVDEALQASAGVRPLLGVVSLDSGATDVPWQMQHGLALMKARYDEAFGTDPTKWVRASPFHQATRAAAPWLGVCAAKRPDDSCGQARAFAEKLRTLGGRATVLPRNLSHGAINAELGKVGEYTEAVDVFLNSLDPSFRRAAVLP